MNWLESSVIAVLVSSGLVLIEKLLERKWAKVDKKEDKKENTEDKLLDTIESLNGEIKTLKEDMMTFKEEMGESIDVLREKLQELWDVRAKDIAEERRLLIINAADELSAHPERMHTKEWWYQVTCHCDVYENYCNSHPLFKNSQAISSIKLIKGNFDEVLKNHNFTDKEV